MKVEPCLFFAEPESDDAHIEGAVITHQNVGTLYSRYRLATPDIGSLCTKRVVGTLKDARQEKITVSQCSLQTCNSTLQHDFALSLA